MWSALKMSRVNDSICRHTSSGEDAGESARLTRPHSRR
jgi:hypothetical protein